MMLIRVNTFAKGLSGVRPELADVLRRMLNEA
jgi:histidine ammonia-lyase